jgi:predicted membrane-bound spermidine synthase
MVPLILTIRKAVLKGAFPLFVFFAAIGFGFMLVEISQMQRLIVFLGHPTYGLSTVLFALLLSSGLGSYLTQAIRNPGSIRPTIAILILLVVLVAFGSLTPPVIRQFQGCTTTTRIGVAVSLLFPLGLFMGMPFPLGMKLASTRSASLTPWLWGINGATSVCASVVAMVIALNSGITASFWTGFFCYAAAFYLFCLDESTNLIPHNRVDHPGGRIVFQQE